MLTINSYDVVPEEALIEHFVLQHRPLVKKIALYLKRRLPAHIELDDLLQSGLVGLLEARSHYNAEKGASFETYAGTRIKGAIIDSLRKTTWTQRDTFKNMKKMSEAITKVEQRNQTNATTKEIAAEMQISIDEYFEVTQDINIASVLSLDVLNYDNDDYAISEDITNPQDIIQHDNMRQLLKSTLTLLPEREQLILTLYYIEELTFKQIAETLDLTEARICQLHSQALAKVRGKMTAIIKNKE